MAADKPSLEKQLEDYRFALSKVSHEVRNPVTLINSYLQLLEKDHPELKSFPGGLSKNLISPKKCFFFADFSMIFPATTTPFAVSSVLRKCLRSS